MKKSVLILVLCVFAITLNAKHEISGYVTDDAGQPLPGVTITIKGTTSGTTSDFEGKFEIEVEDDDVLVISFIGFVSAEVEAAGKTSVSVILTPDVSGLDEVVVAGLGRKSCLSGAISRIRIKSKSSGSVSSSLSGKVAGVDTGGSSVKIKPKAESESYGTSTDIRANNPGVLTAGEWSDIENWQFWKSLMDNSNWSEMQDYWGFDLSNRISVNVKNREKQSLNNIKVALYDSKDNLLWQAVTNTEGRAELWPDIFGNNAKAFRIILTASDGSRQTFNQINFKKEVLNLTLNYKQQLSNEIDILFAVDATGSMGDELEYLKSELQDIINRVEQNRANLQAKVGLVVYRDNGDEYVVRNHNFDTDLSEARKFLSVQSANGGGDFEEAVDRAVETAVQQMQWNNNSRTRIMFLILDAPPHQRSEDLKRMRESVQKAAKKGICIIPVTASGIDKNTEFLMRFISIATNGTYTFLTDDSGVGDSHVKPTTGDYEVEKLNDLIVRLIMKFSGYNKLTAKQ